MYWRPVAEMATTRITDAVPMTMPSAVRMKRTLEARKLSIASLAISLSMMVCRALAIVFSKERARARSNEIRRVRSGAICLVTGCHSERKGSGLDPANKAGRSQVASARSSVLVRSKCDGDGLGLGVVVQDLFAHFAAPAGLLVSAEGQGSVEDVVAVDPHGAGAKTARHFVGQAQVLRPH